MNAIWKADHSMCQLALDALAKQNAGLRDENVRLVTELLAMKREGFQPQPVGAAIELRGLDPVIEDALTQRFPPRSDAGRRARAWAETQTQLGTDAAVIASQLWNGVGNNDADGDGA